MVALPKDPRDFIEIAHFNRDICIELSSLPEKEALRGHFKSQAEMWEKFAENVKRISSASLRAANIWLRLTSSSDSKAASAPATAKGL
jgi:hypothetical protein